MLELVLFLCDITFLYFGFQPMLCDMIQQNNLYKLL